ncbi:MAG: class I SAM-dependent methyltransferase [Ruegeria sp.]
MSDNKEQADYWSSASGLKWITFEQELDTVFERVNLELIRRARPTAGERVLDIGCGTGATTRAFARHLEPDGAITALDISEPLLEHARARADGLTTKPSFLLLDAQQDSIPGAPFDIVTSRFGVMFFADPISAFANVRRHMRAGGRMVVAAWAPMSENPWFDVPNNAAVDRLGPADPTVANAPGPLGFQDIDHVVGMLKRAGFSDATGEAANVTLVYLDDLRKVVALASNIGPAARILKKYHGTRMDVEAILEAVLQKFRKFENPQSVDIPARLNFFEATNP